MGVQIYLLEPKTVTLLVDGLPQEIGTLRRFWKVTEVDEERSKEIDAAKLRLEGKAAPIAVMVADGTEMSLAANPSNQVNAHIVLGWDADRSLVTDAGWDWLPVLGYAVMTGDAAKYQLHEESGTGLVPVSRARAIELGIHDTTGRFVRLGQPLITECRSVEPYIASYVQADCRLANGKTAEMLTIIRLGEMPEKAWYAGKRPSDVAHFP
jgi:hypothetical protein